MVWLMVVAVVDLVIVARTLDQGLKRRTLLCMIFSITTKFNQRIRQVIMHGFIVWYLDYHTSLFMVFKGQRGLSFQDKASSSTQVYCYMYIEGKT